MRIQILIAHEVFEKMSIVAMGSFPKGPTAHLLKFAKLYSAPRSNASTSRAQNRVAASNYPNNGLGREPNLSEADTRFEAPRCQS
jgi:hypothetical protein